MHHHGWKRYGFLVLITLVALSAACVSTKKPKPETPLGMNTSDIYRLGMEALKPLADQYIERGDRVLLLQSRLFNRSDAWRFIPTPLEIPQDVFEVDIRQKVSAAFKPAS